MFPSNRTLRRSAYKHSSANLRREQNSEIVRHSILEAELQRKLECSRVIRRSGLSGGADGRACRGIAYGIDAADVEAIQHVESIRDYLKVEALSDVELLGDAQVNFEEAWLVKRHCGQDLPCSPWEALERWG